MKLYSFIAAIFISLNAFSYNDVDKKVKVVKPIYETPQVISKGDAADDPAIWLNQTNPSKSLIFGTDKRSGIYTYNLNGDKINYVEASPDKNKCFWAGKKVFFLKKYDGKLIYIKE